MVPTLKRSTRIARLVGVQSSASGGDAPRRSRSRASDSARQARTHHKGAHGTDDPTSTVAHAVMNHDMWSRSLGEEWDVLRMAQVFPIVTLSAPSRDDNALRGTALCVRIYVGGPMRIDTYGVLDPMTDMRRGTAARAAVTRD